MSPLSKQLDALRLIRHLQFALRPDSVSLPVKLNSAVLIPGLYANILLVSEMRLRKLSSGCGQGTDKNGQPGEGRANKFPSPSADVRLSVGLKTWT